MVIPTILFVNIFTRGRKMKDKTTSIYKNAILNKATDVLQIFIKYIIVIISMLFLGFIFLQSFFGTTFLDFCESSFFIEKPFWSTVLIVLIPILIAIIVKTDAAGNLIKDYSAEVFYFNSYSKLYFPWNSNGSLYDFNDYVCVQNRHSGNGRPGTYFERSQ